MSYCPEHGDKMECIGADDVVFAEYLCPEGEGWIYDADEGTYQSMEAAMLMRKFDPPRDGNFHRADVGDEEPCECDVEIGHSCGKSSV